MAQSSRPLLNVPPELIVRIASNLTTPQLGSFRASCKQIEQYLFNSFAKEFFTKRQFMIEHESLEALLGIANHPGLASSLQEVIIDTQMFNFDHANKYAVRNLMQERFRKGYLARDVLITTGLAKSMLVDTFSKLPNLNVVGLRNYNGTGRRRDGEGACWRSWGWSYLESMSHAHPQAILPLLLSALAAANARPTRIEVFLRPSEQLNADSFTLVDGGRNHQSLLENLKTLMLSIGMTRSEEYILQDADTDLYQAPIRSFLSRIASLEHLRLNFVTSQAMAGPLLDWMSGCCSNANHLSINLNILRPEFKDLSTLDIGMATVNGDTLIRVLAHFDLRSFSLWKVYLIPDGMSRSDENLWPTFLSNLSARLLQTSRIGNMMIGFALQDLHSSSGGVSRYVPITWAPRGTMADKKATATSEHIIKYQAQTTNETPQEWLQAMSKLVSALHGYQSSFGGSDDDGLDTDVEDMDDMEFDSPDHSEDEDDDIGGDEEDM